MNTDIYGESPALSLWVRAYDPYHVLNWYRDDTFKTIQRQSYVQTRRRKFLVHLFPVHSFTALGSFLSISFILRNYKIRGSFIHTR